MKKLLVVALAMIAIASNCVAQEVAVVVEEESSPLTFDVGADIYSAYIWRGIQVNDEPVVQPAASLGYDLGDLGSISAGVWGNYDLTNFRKGDGRADGFSEVDCTVSYAIDISDVSLEAGNIWYLFPNQQGPSGASTEEVYGSVAYNNEIVVPSFSLYYDYNYADGFYGSFALSKDIEINDQVSAGVFSSLGAADDDFAMAYYGENESIVDFNLGASVTYAINDNLSVGATVVWTSLVDSGIRDNADASGYDEDMLWGGINLAASF